MATGRKRRKSKGNASIEVTSTRSGGVDIDAENVNIGGDVVGRDKITNIVNTVNNIFFGSAAESRDRRNLLILLEKVRTFWVEGVLENSLHGAALIDLGIQVRAEAVEHPWEMVLSTTAQPIRTLPPGQRIEDIFDEMGHALLILGEPGSGKTTTLLELARDLITRAEQDPTLPVPVVFNLSSWSKTRRDLFEWLVSELNMKYQIPRRIGQRWLENNDLTLLLDGLDEVAAEHRKACVHAINQFRQEQGLTSIAICSRTREYEELTERLKLNSAIVIQPLAREQIDRYIAAGGPQLATLGNALQIDPTLEGLAQSPLMLSIMSVAYQDARLENLASEQLDSIQRRKHLFDAYVDRMFTRTARVQHEIFPKEQSISWLSWLAQRMSQHNRSIFLIERLQPSWLPTGPWRMLYTFGSRALAGLIVGLVLPYALVEGETGLIGRLIFGLSAGLSAGLGAGSIAWVRLRRSRTKIETEWTQPSLQRLAIDTLISGAIIGLISGLIGALIKWLAAPDFEELREELLLLGVPIGLLYLTPLGIIFGLRVIRQSVMHDIRTVEAIRWSWAASVKGAFIGLGIGAGAGLLLWLVLTLVYPDAGGVRVGLALTTGLYGALLGGLLGGLRGTTISIEEKYFPNQGIWLSLRNAALGWLVGGVGIGLIGLTPWLMGSKPSIELGILGIGLNVGLLAALWYGGLDVIQHFTLRLILNFTGHAPWNYARFLDYAAERIFLRKVGGGYIFIHRLLMEYFASLEPEQST